MRTCVEVPGNLTRALGITGAQNRAAAESRAAAHRGPRASRGALPVAWSPRIGIRVGTDRPWRAYVPGTRRCRGDLGRQARG